MGKRGASCTTSWGALRPRPDFKGRNTPLNPLARNHAHICAPTRSSWRAVPEDPFLMVSTMPSNRGLNGHRGVRTLLMMRFLPPAPQHTTYLEYMLPGSEPFGRGWG